MTVTTTIDLAPILALPIEKRLEIVHAIWDSIAEEGGPPESDELKAELARRLQAYRDNPADVVPWEEVRAAALARIRR